MTEMDAERMEHRYNHFFHPIHGHYHHPHTSTPLNGAEAYQQFLRQKQHVLFELKIAVIVLVGVIVIVACVVYIVLQCRARLRPQGLSSRGQRDDEKDLFGSTDTLENLIPAENSIRLKVCKEKEFFV